MTLLDKFLKLGVAYKQPIREICENLGKQTDKDDIFSVPSIVFHKEI